MSALGFLGLGLATDPTNIGRNWNESTASLKVRLQQALAAGRPLWTRPWVRPSAWTTGEAVKQGDVRSNSATPTQWYVAVNSGTCGATEPTHTNGSATSDGAVAWSHLGGPSWDAADDPAKPTVTLTGSTSIPAGLAIIDVWSNRSLFAFNGCAPAQSGLRANLNIFTPNASTAAKRGGSVAFWSDAPKLGFEVLLNTNGIQIFCDGRPVTVGPFYPKADAQYWSTVDWGTRKPRLWEIHYGLSGAALMLIAMTSADQIWAPTKGPRGVFIGDSYVDGSSYGPFLLGNPLSEHLGRLIGIDDMWRMGIGGTGLLNPNTATGPYYTYRERVPQLLALKPDAIFVYGSTNDVWYTQSALTAEALAFFDAIRAGSSAPIFWFGPSPLATNYSAIQMVDTAIATAVAARPSQNIFYKSILAASPPWFTGSHNNANYTWTSNISQYIGGDNTHPVDKGTMYLAGRMANAYANELLPLVA